MPLETKTGLRVTLSIAQRGVLVMLSERGRRVIMDPTNFKPEAVAGLAEMQKMGLMNINTIIGRGSSREYELTDLGAQVVDQIYASQKQSAQIENLVEKVTNKP